MKFNYPIKYAAMPVIEQVGLNHGMHDLERNYDVVCYIVSKCYLLSDKTKYKENGKTDKEYEVVFPYQEVEYNWQRVTPKFGGFNFHCINSNFVEKVFENYNEALNFVNEKNQELCDKTLRYLPCSKDIKAKKVEEFNNKLSMYKLLEQQILINTSDLEQSNIKELNNLIIRKNGKNKILLNNLYEYLNFSLSSNFIVYSISLEEYNNVLAVIKYYQDDSLQLTNSNPILYHEKDNNRIMVVNNDGSILYYIDKTGLLPNNNSQKLSVSELNINNDKIEYLFTTETLEDIILSFSKHEYINLDKPQDPVLKKTLCKK